MIVERVELDIETEENLALEKIREDIIKMTEEDLIELSVQYRQRVGDRAHDPFFQKMVKGVSERYEKWKKE